MSYSTRQNLCWFTLIVMAAPTYLAAEIHSNTTGGGPWSHPETWHGGRVPSEQDRVVIAMGDVVVVDINHMSQASCQDLFIDPTGVLTFSPTDGSHSLTVNGNIDSYGLIRMDASRRPTSQLALRIMAEPNRSRMVHLRHGAALLAHGSAQRPPEHENVSLTIATHPGQGDLTPDVRIVANGRAAIDLHRALLSNVKIEARSLDNTGSRADERINLVGNRFTGHAQVTLQSCDTPVVRGNYFSGGANPRPNHAVHAKACKLVQLHANRVSGYDHGFIIEEGMDASVVDNELGDCLTGLHLVARDVMLKNNLVTRCDVGVYIAKTSGVIENTTVSESPLAFHAHYSTTLQFTNCRTENLPEAAVPLRVDRASVRLLNCNIPVRQVDTSFHYRGPTTTSRKVESFHYLVVKVHGNLPPNTQVDVRTADISGGVPPGKADSNVRNAPAFLNTEGLTLLPPTMQSLIVRGWGIRQDGTIIAAPFYDLNVSIPSGQPSDARETLVSKQIETDEHWFRPDLEDATPTFEVTLP